MLRKISFLLLFASSILFAGCIDVLEEMTLNEDGSGTYMLRYDLSAMLSDPSMRELMQSSMEGQEGAEGLNELDNVDTLIHIYDNLGPQVENREFWKKVKVHMVMNSSTNEYKIDILMDFKSVDEVAYAYENLSSVSGEGESLTQITSMLPGSPVFSKKKKSLVRTSLKAEKEESEEDMSMIEMFLSEAKHTCVYHLPGKVSSAKIPNAQIEGSTVTVENSLLDVMKGEAKLDGVIKYK